MDKLEFSNTLVDSMCMIAVRNQYDKCYQTVQSLVFSSNIRMSMKDGDKNSLIVLMKNQ